MQLRNSYYVVTHKKIYMQLKTSVFKYHIGCVSYLRVTGLVSPRLVAETLQDIVWDDVRWLNNLTGELCWARSSLLFRERPLGVWNLYGCPDLPQTWNWLQVPNNGKSNWLKKKIWNNFVKYQELRIYAIPELIT